MFRIDRSTPSIDDMEITLSEPRIEESREYKEKGQYVMEQVLAKKMTGTEGRELLDGVFETLKRYMDAKRKREARRNPSTTTRKKVERDYEKLKQKGWDKRDFGMEVVKETYTVKSDMYSVAIPGVDEFIERALQMKKDMLAKQKKDLDPQRIQHYCMASVGLKGSAEKFYTRTSHTPVLTPDGDVNEEFYVRLCGKVETLLDRVPDYEERDAELMCCNATMTYTISQWESIKKWYPTSNAPFPKYKYFSDFTVFLASNEEISCEQQCVEELNHIFYGFICGQSDTSLTDHEDCGATECPRRKYRTWDPTKKFEDMIPQEKVLTYIPCQGDMRYVTQFSDLMTSFHENVSNTDCKNIARIIKWNDHVAVITAMKPVKKRLRVQTRRAIKVEASEENEVFVDIEAFSRTLSGNYTQQVPYLVCWADKNEMNHVSGEDCMEEFVEQLLKKYTDKGEITLYAWYGSGYDYQHIYPYLKAKSKIALNGGGYGKFVQKPIDIDTYIVRRDVIAGECEKLKEDEDGKIFFGGSLIKKPNFYQLDGERYDKMVVESEAEPYYSAQNGVSI
ncbi:hypothetical protein GGI13_003872, partial [Coemansia sp. RSA 455]